MESSSLALNLDSSLPFLCMLLCLFGSGGSSRVNLGVTEREPVGNMCASLIKCRGG